MKAKELIVLLQALTPAQQELEVYSYNDLAEEYVDTNIPSEREYSDARYTKFDPPWEGKNKVGSFIEI